MSPKTTIYLRLLFVCFIFTSNTLEGQNKTKQDSPKSLGVSVSPAHFHFNQQQGEIKTYKITVRNITSSPKDFKVNIYDFDMNGKGKSSFLPAGKGKYSLSK